MNRNISKSSKRRLLIFGSISMIIVIYFLFSLTTMTYNIKVLTKKQNKLEQSLLELKEDEDELKNMLEKLNDPDYIARYARETYLYSKDGEYIIILEKTDKKEVEAEKIVDYSKYVLVGSGIVLLLILIYIIRKSKKN